MGWASINVWGVLGSELFAVSSWNRCASIFNMLLLLASSHRPPIASPTPSILIICLAAACGGKAAQSQCESLTNPYAKRQLMFALRNGIVRWMLRVLQFRLGTRPPPGIWFWFRFELEYGSVFPLLTFCLCIFSALADELAVQSLSIGLRRAMQHGTAGQGTAGQGTTGGIACNVARLAAFALRCVNVF